MTDLPMTAAERLSMVDDLPAVQLCQRTADTLDALVEVMNQETNLLRAGRYRESTVHAAEKTRLAQDYVGLVRAVQRQSSRLLREAPEAAQSLRSGHEKLVTQMAENLRVIATAKSVTEDLLSDVALAVGNQGRTKTYGAAGQMQPQSGTPARGIAVNRAL